MLKAALKKKQMKKTHDEGPVRTAFFNTGNDISALQKKLPELEERFTKLFGEGLRMGETIHSFLETNFEISKQIRLPYTDEQKQRMKIMVEKAGQVHVTILKTKEKLLARKGAFERMTEECKKSMVYISRTFPDENKCFEEIGRLQLLYEDYLKWHDEINSEITGMTNLIREVNTQMKEFQN
jgi:hypothetical protein